MCLNCSAPYILFLNIAPVKQFIPWIFPYKYNFVIVYNILLMNKIIIKFLKFK